MAVDFAGAMGILRELEFFVVEEPTRGSLTFPTLESQRVIGAGDIPMDQQPSMSPSPEIVNSRDVIKQFQDVTPAGTISIPTLMTPSGTAGTPPQGAALYKALLGVETITPGVSVVYSQSLKKPSVSFWCRKGPAVFFGRGGSISSLAPTITNAGGALQTFTGGFMELGWVGMADVDGAVTDSGIIPVKVSDAGIDAATLFTAGGRVTVDGDDNTGAGYEILSTGTGNITLDGTFNLVGDESVEPFLPTFTPIGDSLANKNLTITFDGTAATIQSLSMTYNDPTTYLTNEITADGFPSKYIEGVRDGSGTLQVTFMAEDLEYFHIGKAATVTKNIVAKIGNVSGMMGAYKMPKTQIAVPNVVVGEADSLALSMGVMALGSGTGENSLTIEFT